MTQITLEPASPDWVYSTVKQFCHRHPAFTVGGLRHLIFNEKTNGFSSAFKRVGRRVLIDEAEFFNCVERQNGRAK